MTGPRILVLDIETMPAVAEVFSLFDQRIPIQRVREPGYVFGFGYKWVGRGEGTHWVQEELAEPDAHWVAAEAYALLDEADIVVTYNGDRFDLPHLNAAMVRAGLTPPSPYKSVDLYKTVRQVLKLESNKLDYVARVLGLGAKLDTDYSLWRRCMAGDAKAAAKMARYCKQDVRLTEQVYLKLLAWAKNHPNVNLWGGPGDGRPSCTRCKSTRVTKQGYQRVVAQTYQRYKCEDCGTWMKGTEIIERAAGGTRPA